MLFFPVAKGLRSYLFFIDINSDSYNTYFLNSLHQQLRGLQILCMSQNARLTGVRTGQTVPSLSLSPPGNSPAMTDPCSGPTLNSPQFIDVSPALGGPELDTVSRYGLMRAEYRRIINPLPPLTRRDPAYTAQVLLALVKVLIHQINCKDPIL